MSEKTVAVSGGFDPLHAGHVRMINEARTLGDKLVVILNNDNWLKAKKGYVFMNEEERKEVLLSLSSVDEVVISSHKENDADKSVSRDLEELKPAIFANGGDRDEENAKNPGSSLYKDIQVCKENNIEMVFNVGTGGKVQSSSLLTDQLRISGIKTDRPWGSMVLYAHGDNFWLKTITVNPNSRLSLQKHKYRGEFWMCIDGKVTASIDGKDTELKPFESVRFEVGTEHRLSSKSGGTVVEIGFGVCDEKDNTRLEDDYNRTELA